MKFSNHITNIILNFCIRFSYRLDELNFFVLEVDYVE